MITIIVCIAVSPTRHYSFQCNISNLQYFYEIYKEKQVYIGKKKHPYDCFTNLSIPMTALWCPAFSNHD